MSDLIERQKAIDVCNIVIDLWKGQLGEGITIAIKKRIADLPSAQPEIVRCHKCIYWDRDTVRQNSNDAGWWNEAVCKRYSDEIWTSWKDADWYCADAERKDDE